MNSLITHHSLLITCLLPIFLGICLCANAELLPKAVLLPSYSVSVCDDAMATTINPAGLGIGRGMSAYYFHTFSTESGGDNAFFMASSGFGFSAEFTNPGPVKFRKYTLSDGVKVFNGMYIGSNYSWFGSGNEYYDSLKSWDIGLLYRPSDFFSMGFVARNLNRPAFFGIDTDRTYDLSLAFRPYTNRLTLSIDSIYQEGEGIRDAKFSYAMECEPIDGLILRCSYNSNSEFDARLSLGFSQFGIGAYNRFDSDWNNDGGVGYIRISGEQRRSKIQAGRYALAMKTSDLAHDSIPNSLIKRAKEDKTIRGILLKLGMESYSMAEVQEMRDLILDFRLSGKEVICYMELAGNKEYYLASACDKILLNPAGYLYLNGFRSEVTFYKSGLDKLGIEADFLSVGKYKSASEMFSRDGISDAYRESLNSLLDDLSDQMVIGIANGRNISTEEVRQRINEGPYTAKEAMAAGLVDALIYKDQLIDVEKQIFGKGVIEIEGKLLADIKPYRYDWAPEPKLAIIYANGIIAPGKSMFTNGMVPLLPLPSIMGSETITESIRKVREDSSVKAIVLRIDSGGGSVFASDLIWREVALAQERKPVIVSMGGAAASGGYYIAAPADVIVADPATVTGSIGVIAGKFNLRGIYDKLGIKKEIFKRGDNADFYTTYSGFSDEQREILTRQIQEMYDDFVSKVANGRGMKEEAVEEIAQGRVWTGRQAKENGLVDELGDLHLAISIAKEKAGLEPDEGVDIISLPKRFPLWYRIFLENKLLLTDPLNLASLTNITEITERFANDKMFYLIPYSVDYK